jgi:endoglucanase
MRTRRIALALLAALCLGTPAAASAAAPQPKVVGNHLIDQGTGQAFVPRGVNWASFEYACFYGYAYSDSAAGGSVDPTAAGAAVIASWHVNTVRVPLNQDCWLGEDGSPAFGTVAGYRAAVKDWVDTLRAAGLAVILDLHWSGPAGVKADGQRAMADDRSDDFWASVAATFKDDPSVMFDVFNEPYSRTPAIDLTWACWRDGGCNAPTANDQQPVTASTFATIGMTQLVAAIRGAGAAQPILLGGRDYANDLGQWLQNRPADAQLVASFHNYNGQTCHTTACWDATIAPVAAQVPVVTGEFGETDCGDSHLNGYMDWADRHDVGYLAWGWWVLRDQPSCETLALLSDGDGTPRAPNGTALKAHLAALAKAGTGSTPVTPGLSPSLGGPALPGASRDTAAPRLVLGGRARQHLGRTATVTVRCNEACSARATGTLALVVRGRRSSLKLSPASGKGAAGRTLTLKLALAAKVRRAVTKALRRHGRATATIVVRATDAAHNSTTTRRTVRLVR